MGGWVFACQLHPQWEERGQPTSPRHVFEISEMLEFRCRHRRGQLHLEDSSKEAQATDCALYVDVVDDLVRNDV